MHKFLEQYVINGVMNAPGSNPYSQQGHSMAQRIVQEYLEPNVTEYYGSEVNLFYPELYAGTTDCVANWAGQLSILDFKQTNRPKKTEWIEDYFLQLAAYALAHNEIYGTNIRQGVILMCSQDGQPQHWVIKDSEFDSYIDAWVRRVDEFYS